MTPITGTGTGYPAFAGTAEELGARHRPAIQRNLDGYLTLFGATGATEDRVRAWAERALERTAAWAPRLVAEIEAVARGAGLQTWQVAAMNARTEILAALRDTGPGECSTLVVLRDGGPPLTLQTWDWLDHLRDAPLLWEYAASPDRVVRTFTEAGTLAKIGVSDAGLGVHFNILRHAGDSADIGVPVHLVARRILDEATTVGEATEIARSARTSASTVLTVVTRDAARVLEISPAGVGVVDPREDGVLAHTNHFLDPALATGEVHGVERPGTYARLAHLLDGSAALAAPDDTARTRAMTTHGEAPVCAHPDPALPLQERWTTLAAISIDLSAARLRVHRGRLCQVAETTWQNF